MAKVISWHGDVCDAGTSGKAAWEMEFFPESARIQAVTAHCGTPLHRMTDTPGYSGGGDDHGPVGTFVAAAKVW